MDELHECFEERPRLEACRPDPDDPVHDPVWSDIARDDRGVYATVIAPRPVTLRPGERFRIPVTIGARGRGRHPYIRFRYRYADGRRPASVIWRVPDQERIPGAWNDSTIS